MNLGILHMSTALSTVKIANCLYYPHIIHNLWMKQSTLSTLILI